jgi:hypothetical protein
MMQQLAVHGLFGLAAAYVAWTGARSIHAKATGEGAACGGCKGCALGPVAEASKKKAALVEAGLGVWRG